MQVILDQPQIYINLNLVLHLIRKNYFRTVSIGILSFCSSGFAGLSVGRTTSIF